MAEIDPTVVWAPRKIGEAQFNGCSSLGRVRSIASLSSDRS